jgi:hypothetical protein
MRSNAFNKCLAALEENARSRIIATLVDFVLWRAKWRRGVEEVVEIATPMVEALRRRSWRE